MSHATSAQSLSELHEMQEDALRADRLLQSANGAVLPQLPPETLARIFELLRDNHPLFIRQSNHFGSESSYLGWPIVSHVCKRWRSVCLEHRVLWTRLTPEVLSHSGVRDVFLKRSGQAPLFVELTAVPENEVLYKTYVQLLTTELSRIRVLRYTYPEVTAFLPGDNHDPGTGLLPDICTLLDKPAPALRELVLNGERSPVDAHRQNDIISRFLSTYATNLHSLELHGFRQSCYPWRTPLSSLRTLRLHIYSRSQAFTYTFVELLDGIRQMATLEELALSGPIPTASSQSDSPRYQPVVLPRLRRITLGTGAQYFRLWSCIIPNVHCFVDIVALSKIDELNLFRTALKSHIASADLSSLSRITVKPIGNTLCITALSCDEDDPRPPPRRSLKGAREFVNPGLRFYLTWGGLGGGTTLTANALAGELLPMIPMANVTRLDLNVSRALWPDAKLSLVLTECLPALESLFLNFCHNTIVEPVLQSLARIDEGSASPKPPLPRLQKISFSDCRFLQSTVDALVHALKTRTCVGHQIMDVDVKRCTIRKRAWITGLNSWNPSIIGRRVEWDGVMGTDQSQSWPRR